MANEVVARDAKEVVIRDWNTDLWADVVTIPGGNALLVSSIIGGSVNVQNIESEVPLGIGITFTGAARDCQTYSYFCGRVFTDQLGELYIDSSLDNIVWDLAFTQPCIPNILYEITWSVAARWYRVRYWNNGIVQTVFRLSSMRKP